MLFDPKSDFELARRVRGAEGAPLADVFSFVSGLYFRGKASYAKEFAPPHAGQPRAFVITAGGGLCRLEEPVTLSRLGGWSRVSIHEENPHFTTPLFRHASELSQAYGDSARFVLLGSLASNKYLAPLLEVFAERLYFPSAFKGLGDMSRGALLLRAVRERRELEYEPVLEARSESW